MTNRITLVGASLLMTILSASIFVNEAMSAFKYLISTYSLIYIDSASLMIGCL